MSDPAVIYLQPECCADPGTGRLWCEDDAPVDCEEGAPWTKYVLAADAEAAIDALEAKRVGQVAAMNQIIATVTERADKAEAEIERAVQSFDAWRANPYTKVLEASIENDYAPKSEIECAVRVAVEMVLRGMRSEDDSTQLRAIIASVEAITVADVLARLKGER